MLNLEQILTTLQQPLLGNSLRQWLIAVAITLIALITFLILRKSVATRLSRYAERFQLKWVRVVAHLTSNTRTIFLLVLALYAGSLVLDLPAKPTLILNTAAILFVLFQAALWGHAFVTFAVAEYVQRRMQADASSVTTVTALGFLAKVVLWTLVILLSLDNVGVNVTALIAGLGIGGIAIALAAQNILGDLFASLSIVLDKPFVLGDVIAVGDFTGTVERIGVKTTRLRSLSGEQLIFANNELLKSTIRNYKRQADRRVVFSVEISRDTSPAKVLEIAGMIREAIEAQQPVRVDRVHFSRIGPSSLIFEAVYFVLSADYNLFMNIQQSINLMVLQRFESAGVQFAVPTQAVYMHTVEKTEA